MRFTGWKSVSVVVSNGDLSSGPTRRDPRGDHALGTTRSPDEAVRRRRRDAVSETGMMEL